MKIIGTGFARTGTSSLKAALEQLGFGPCYHMVIAYAPNTNLRMLYHADACNIAAELNLNLYCGLALAG
jgi:Sulfotransferase domain